MKSAFIALVLMFTTSALADQSITCNQVTKKGKIRANGGTVKMNLEFTVKGEVNEETSTVETTGFTKKGEESYLSDMKIRSVNQGIGIADNPYTTFFLDADNDLMLDIQLQFDRRILNKKFRDMKAVFVIGSDDANPETSWSYGYDMVCNGRLK